MKLPLQKSYLLGITALGAAAALFSATSAVQAAPTFISTAQGRGADLQIRGGGFANDNFGTSDILRVRTAANVVDVRKTYLRFDLGTLPKAKTDATGVSLGLQLAPSDGHSPADKVWTFNVSALPDALPSESWEEKGINWNNAPASDPKSASKLTAEALPLGTFTITGKGQAGQIIKFSSPELLKLVQQDTNGIVTLIITRQDAGEAPDNDVIHIFASKEYATPAPPVLSVAFGADNADLPDAAHWALLPVGVKPLPFESDIEAFEAADLKNPPAKGGIEFVGSSSIRKWTTLDQDFPGMGTFNRGFGGSHVIDSVHFAQRIVTPYEPREIVFYAGTNDLADGTKPEEIAANFKAFVGKVREKLPTVPIKYISVSPAPSRWNRVNDIKKTNSLIEAYCKATPNLEFIDIFPLMLDANGKPRPELFVDDQLHMNPAGYAIWTKAVAPYLLKP